MGKDVRVVYLTVNEHISFMYTLLWYEKSPQLCQATEIFYQNVYTIVHIYIEPVGEVDEMRKDNTKCIFAKNKATCRFDIELR